MEGRRPARYLAPIALVIALAGTYVIVEHNRTHHGSTATRHQPLATGGKGKPRGSRLQRAKFYVVQQGDNLSGIAAKVHIPLATLEGLNSGLDPNTLQTGDRIRLRR